MSFFLGLHEFVKKGDPPVVGITKLGNGVTLEKLKRPRREPPQTKSAAASATENTTSSSASSSVSSSSPPPPSS